jgi:hypothetical protein
MNLLNPSCQYLTTNMPVKGVTDVNMFTEKLDTFFRKKGTNVVVQPVSSDAISFGFDYQTGSRLEGVIMMSPSGGAAASINLGEPIPGCTPENMPNHVLLQVREAMHLGMALSQLN